jgi:hypothetical protein
MPQPVLRRRAFASAIASLGLPAVAAAAAAAAQGAASAGPAPPAPRITDKLERDAAALEPLVKAGLAKRFLAATARLVEPSARTVYRNRDKGLALSRREYEARSAAMPADERASFTPREFPPAFYYETAYGSPLVYARVLDLAAPHLSLDARPKLLDFGYGTIGQLQLLAHCGFDAHGVDVEPVFPALYSEPGDTGAIGTGSVTIHLGQWPADAGLRAAIAGDCALITSKNTLKNGYIHPSPPPGQVVDPRKLVHLGVGDQAFLSHVRDALKPGGVFLVYNICPPQNPPDQEYLPWADGTSPFPRALFEKVGFQVLAFDERDDAWVLDCFDRLGYTEGMTREQARKAFLCWYTVVRRRPGA